MADTPKRSSSLEFSPYFFHRTQVDHFRDGILGWVIGDHSANTFQRLWNAIAFWRCYFWVTDENPVYPIFISDGDQIVSKTYMALWEWR